MTSDRRRTEDTVVDMLRDGLAEAKNATAEVAKGLGDHIRDCAKLQKLQLIALGVVIILVEGHSPEVVKLLAKIGEMLLP